MPQVGHGRLIAKVRVGPPLLLIPPKPVKRIGRDVARCYCLRCNQKKRLCTCVALSEAA